MEEDKFSNAMDWAEQEEQKELEQIRKRQQEEWMNEELERNKKELGEDFGEDVKIDFTEI